jgi:hypothetical protein
MHRSRTWRLSRQSTASIRTRCPGLYPPHHLQNGLASNLRSSRNVSAELHGLMRNFTAAGANGDGRNQSSKNDSFLHLNPP